MSTRRFPWFLAIPAALLAIVPASACTGIRLKAGDGSVISARTMEFAPDLRSEIIVVPRGRAYVGSGPGGKAGLSWAGTYGFAGMNAFGLPTVVDGLNEKGLAVGIFYFPGYATYQAVGEGEIPRSLAPHELGGYLLGTSATVAEAIAKAREVVVGEIPLGKDGPVLPVHYAVHDASGRSAVLEFVDGKLVVHDNPLGVTTNSPTFDWHVTNLRNYVNLSVNSVPPVELAGLRLAPLGQGAGLFGIPGDFTPPSRFVRAVAFTQTATPTATARDAVDQAFHILNHFDIPRGSVRETGKGPESFEVTQWTAVADLANLRYHFHTEANRKVRMVDLRRLDLDAKEIRTIPTAEGESFEDISRQAG
ncbi:linear amide C-N hydrolase [Tundrisphaera sp. TA3]|uniref:linear amide C-N hydrolase n=1 Tax=Tundrisphaera sp. TA3 TaxID=3435775 RepID=UPI003EB90598